MVADGTLDVAFALDGFRDWRAGVEHCGHLHVKDVVGSRSRAHD
jgi:hypothetical protein